MKSNKGFSLVELIVVIAIMAIIAGVAIPVYTTYMDKANKASDEQLFADIQDVLTYALVADTDNSKFGGSAVVVIGENGIDTSITKAEVIAALTEAELNDVTLNYDEWNSSKISTDIAAAIAGSSYFNDGTGVNTDKAGELLDHVQDLANAFEAAVGASGNEAVFSVSENIAEIAKKDKENGTTLFRDAWVGETLMLTNPLTLISSHYSTLTDDALTKVAIYYANAKALVDYTNVNFTGNSSQFDAFNKAFSDLTVAFNNLTDPTINATMPGDGNAEKVANAMGSAMNGMLTAVATAGASSGDDLAFYNVVDGYLKNGTLREKDFNAFVSTLDIATDYADELDKTQENLFSSTEVKNHVNSQLNSMNAVKDLTGLTGSEGTVVIVVTKNANGSITATQYK